MTFVIWNSYVLSQNFLFVRELVCILQIFSVHHRRSYLSLTVREMLFTDFHLLQIQTLNAEKKIEEKFFPHTRQQATRSRHG